MAAASLFLLSACNSETSEEAQAMFAQADSYGCYCGDSVDFPLETHLPEGAEADYEMDVETGSYSLTDCLCEIVDFGFVFSGVDPNWPVVVLDARGDTVDFDITVDLFGTAYIVIPHPENLPDADLSVSVDFIADGEIPAPTLVHAGGLCIIENVVGTIPDPYLSQLQSTYILTEPPVQNGGDSIRRAFVPAKMGGAPY